MVRFCIFFDMIFEITVYFLGRFLLRVKSHSFVEDLMPYSDVVLGRDSHF
jgi:hypothetical protein